MDGLKDEFKHGPMEEKIGGWVDGWVSWWVNERMMMMMTMMMKSLAVGHVPPLVLEKFNLTVNISEISYYITSIFFYLGRNTLKLT